MPEVVKGLNLIVTADQNDGDYVTEITKITAKQLEKIMPVIEAVKNFKPYKVGGFTHGHNWPKGEDLPREDLGEKFPEEIYSDIDPKLIELFNDMVPCGQYSVHSIESIELIEVSKVTRLLG